MTYFKVFAFASVPLVFAVCQASDICVLLQFHSLTDVTLNGPGHKVKVIRLCYNFEILFKSLKYLQCCLMSYKTQDIKVKKNTFSLICLDHFEVIS